MQRLNDVISLIHIGENLQTAFVVGLADLGETDLARAAVEQTRAEPFLERLDLTRHRAGRRVELAARCRESAGVHDLDECGHAGQAIHDDAFLWFLATRAWTYASDAAGTCAVDISA